MDKLKDMLQTIDPPPPEPGARDNALQSALAQFDRVQAAKKIKGTDMSARQTGQKPSHHEGGPMKRRFSPVFVKTATWGAVCALVLAGVSVIVPQFFSYRSVSKVAPPAPVTAPPASSPMVVPSSPAVPQAPPPAAPMVALPSPETQAAGSAIAEKAGDFTKGALATGAYSRGMPEIADARVDALMGRPMEPVGPPPPQVADRDRFETLTPNPVKRTAEEPVSTFSIDVDTAAYAFVRRSLNNGVLPPKNAVRVEEMINYFSYDYPLPKDGAVPFKPTITVFPTPWNPATKLVHIAIKGHALAPAQKPRANLVFLVDVSGSMQSADKLPLLKNALRLLVDHLGADDSVALVTYAGQAGTALEPTPVKDKAKILAAIDRLQAGGSTAGAEGIVTAYALAEAKFDPKGINRIILATDGDFNVGIDDPEQLKGFVERKRQSNIFLSVLGFGQGNYNDALMQKLAQNGNGNAAYIDTLNEARKVLVEEASATLFPIAKDVKIQVEFNPAVVAEYRLIGYETRLLKREDFNNDQVDAGEVGAGHSVTALYEITPAGAATQMVDDLRYGKPATTGSQAKSGEYGFLKIRYKLPDTDTSKLISQPIDASLALDSLARVSTEARFAAAVAAFGQLLRGDPYTKGFGYDDVLKLAEPARGQDLFGYRSEFLNLVRLAKSARAM